MGFIFPLDRGSAHIDDGDEEEKLTSLWLFQV